MPMIMSPRRLVGAAAVLEPLEERHRGGLQRAAERDPDIWTIYPYSLRGEHFFPYWERIARESGEGRTTAFAVISDGEVAGVSCFLHIDRSGATVEVGGTYLAPEVRGGRVNPQIKLLMLEQAFVGGARRVGFRVDTINARSLAALDKLGAVREGVVRQDRVTWTGRVRDAVLFSILADEWPVVRERLQARLA